MTPQKGRLFEADESKRQMCRAEHIKQISSNSHVEPFKDEMHHSLMVLVHPKT